MIAILPLLLLGGVAFVEQPIDGLAVFDDEGLDNKLARTWRCADIDGDGAKDILTPNGVAFQRDGQFPKTQQTPFPSLGERSRADVWGNEIYVLLQDRIEVLRWSQGDWQRTLSQPITWSNPSYQASKRDAAMPSQQRPQFTRFLYDIDGDGKPEIVVVSSDGLRVYAKGNLFYEEKAIWPVLPPLQPMFSSQVIWPPNSRTLEVPPMERDATFQIERGALTVFTDESIGAIGRALDRDRRTDGKGGVVLGGADLNKKTVFKATRFGINQDGSLGLTEQPEVIQESAPLSTNWQRLNLNNDDQMDLLATQYVGSTSSPYPVAIYEVMASTDGGKTVYTAQCTGAHPRNVLTDYNRDGRLDIVTESKQLVAGGLKETLVRGFTRREVELDVEIRLQKDDGSFPAKPSLRRQFTVTLDKPPAKLSGMFLRFLKGGFLQVNGDVDGDGQIDAVIHDHPDSLTAYSGSEAAITNSEITSLPISPKGPFYVVDVDEDGRADVLIGRPTDDQYEPTGATLYLSRETAR